MEHDIRPWGQYWVLEDADTHKVKRIEVNPGGRLSYQYHLKRAEVWTIIQGMARVTLDGEVKDFYPGQVVQISKETKHRIQNPGDKPCVFIEVQTGTYLREDDIIRLE